MQKDYRARIRKAIRDQCDTLTKTDGTRQLFDDEFHRKEREQAKLRRLKGKPMKEHLEQLFAELTALRMLYDKTGNVRFPLYMELTKAEQALLKALKHCD